MAQKIIFMGTPEFSVPSLHSLVKSENKILAVYSQPAKKAHRGQKVNLSPVESFARKNSLNVRTPSILNSEEEFNFIKNLNPDIVIVVAYGKIIPKKFLTLSKHGYINLHASLLPRWRGAAPIQRSIMNLDKETGISIMKITEELDAGPVMEQIKTKIHENTNAEKLSEILSNLGANALIESIKKIQTGNANFIEQNSNKATFAKKIKKEESKIKWNEKAENILGKINGLNPNPGAWFEHKGQRYKILSAKIIDQSGKSGFVLDDKLTIGCKEKSLQITEIKKEGKKTLALKEFLLGNKIKKGEKVN